MKAKRGQGNTIEIAVEIKSVIARTRNVTMILSYDEARELSETILGDLLPAHMLEESPRLTKLARGIIALAEERDVVHAGTLMAACGKVMGISGHDQVKLSYRDEQVICLACLRMKLARRSEA